MTGVRFRTGGGAPTGNTRSGVSAGRALNRRSTRPGCDWGWLGVLAGLRFAPGRCCYRKRAHGGRRSLCGLVGEWEVDLDGQAAEGEFLELELPVVSLDRVADDSKSRSMPGNSLSQADRALQYSLPISCADSRAIILDTQHYPQLGHPP